MCKKEKPPLFDTDTDYIFSFTIQMAVFISIFKTCRNSLMGSTFVCKNLERSLFSQALWSYSGLYFSKI